MEVLAISTANTGGLTKPSIIGMSLLDVDIYRLITLLLLGNLR